MMSASDLKIFNESGVLALRGFIPRKLTSAAQTAILAELTRLKFKVKGKFASSKLAGMPIFQQTGHLSGIVNVGVDLERLFTDDLLSIVTDIAKTGLKPARPQLLLSLPHKEDWSLKNLNWHLDLKPSMHDQISGVQAFVLIDDVRAQGGATLALAGSHRLHYVERGVNAHDILRRNPDFTSTPEKFLNPQNFHGTQVQIIEMSGRAGDVYLMDLRVLHTPSVNSRGDLRMMATNRYFADPVSMISKGKK